jgi:hypothetical protein
MIAQTLKSLDLTKNAQVGFAGLGAGDNEIVVRVGQGFTEVAGVAYMTAGGANFKVYQGDGTNWDHEDSFALVLNTELPFAIKILARYVRIVVEVTADPVDIRIHGLLKIGASP